MTFMKVMIIRFRGITEVGVIAQPWVLKHLEPKNIVNGLCETESNHMMFTGVVVGLAHWGSKLDHVGTRSGDFT